MGRGESKASPPRPGFNSYLMCLSSPSVQTGQAASAQLLCLKGHRHVAFLGGSSPSPSLGYLYAITDQTRVLLCLSLLGHRSFSLLPWCGLHSPRPSCSCKGEADHGGRVSTAVMEGLAEHFLGSSPGPNAFYSYFNSYEGQLIICTNIQKDHRSYLPSPFLFSARHLPPNPPARVPEERHAPLLCRGYLQGAGPF